MNHLNYSVSIPKKVGGSENLLARLAVGPGPVSMKDYAVACHAVQARKALLRDVSVLVEPGEMTYIMGPSGAGKSTLLEVMSGRVKSGQCSTRLG